MVRRRDRRGVRGAAPVKPVFRRASRSMESVTACQASCEGLAVHTMASSSFPSGSHELRRRFHRRGVEELHGFEPEVVRAVGRLVAVPGAGDVSGRRLGPCRRCHRGYPPRGRASERDDDADLNDVGHRVEALHGAYAGRWTPSRQRSGTARVWARGLRPPSDPRAGGRPAPRRPRPSRVRRCRPGRPPSSSR